MTQADALVTFAFLMAAVLMTGSSFYFKLPLMWVMTAGLWMLCGANGLRLSTVTWDTMFFLFWFSLALTIVTVMMTLQTRRMQAEEEREEEGEPTDDADDYKKQADEYGDKQKKVGEVTGGSRVRRR